MAAVDRWRLCKVCNCVSLPWQRKRLKASHDALLRLSFPLGSPCRFCEDPSSVPLVAERMLARRARKIRREMWSSNERLRRRLLATPSGSAPPFTEDALQEKSKPGIVFDTIPHSARKTSRKVSLKVISAFNAVTLEKALDAVLERPSAI